MIGYVGDMRRKKKKPPSPQKKNLIFSKCKYGFYILQKEENMFATLIYFNVQKNSKQPHFAKIWQILAKHDNIFAAKWTSSKLKAQASDPNTKVASFENLIMQNENFSVRP